MRKITHINLISAILQENEFDEIKKKSFYIGGLLPDCVPTFIYIKHNIDSTFNKVIKLIEQILVLDINSYTFWRKLGCVMHYISDYFTYPHTKLFNGTFSEHNRYEKILKDTFKNNLNLIDKNNITFFENKNELIRFIKKEQDLYFIKKKVNNSNPFIIDTYYIFNVCNIICLNLINLNKQKVITII